MNNTTNRVLVISPDVKHDLTTAREHGELRYLLPESGSPFTDVSERIHDAITDFRFSEELDLVVVVGPQLHVAIMVGHLLAHFGKVRALIFDSKHDKYCAKWIYAYENEYPPGEQDVFAQRSSEAREAAAQERGRSEEPPTGSPELESPDGPERASEAGTGDQSTLSMTLPHGAVWGASGSPRTGLGSTTTMGSARDDHQGRDDQRGLRRDHR